jgi:hypothetical protein
MVSSVALLKARFPAVKAQGMRGCVSPISRSGTDFGDGSRIGVKV